MNWKLPSLKVTNYKSCQFWRWPKLKVAKIESEFSITFWNLLSCQFAKLPNCQVAKLPNCQIAKWPNCQVAKLPSCKLLICEPAIMERNPFRSCYIFGPHEIQLVVKLFLGFFKFLDHMSSSKIFTLCSVKFI